MPAIDRPLSDCRYYPYTNSTVHEPFAKGYAVQLFANAIAPGDKHGINTTVGTQPIPTIQVYNVIYNTVINRSMDL